MRNRLLLALVLLLISSTTSLAQTTAFTYQGKLADSGSPASGNFDFQFKLFDTATVLTGTQQGALVSVANVTVTNGIFTVQLDFGACPTCFNGASRFLDINVRTAGGGAFTQLAPRQPVTSNPYAIKSLNATAADGLSVACVNCVTSSQIQSVSGGAVTGTIPVASVPAGSASYIQNSTSPQAADFNISGNGTAGGTLNSNIVNAATQFNLAGRRILTGSLFNTFTGDSAGAANASGGDNSFYGRSAGAGNTMGNSNSFFGAQAGVSNALGSANSYFGTSAGLDIGAKFFFRSRRRNL